MGKTRKRGHRSEIDDRGIEGKENGAQRNEGKDWYWKENNWQLIREIDWRKLKTWGDFKEIKIKWEKDWKRTW